MDDIARFRVLVLVGIRGGERSWVGVGDGEGYSLTHPEPAKESDMHLLGAAGALASILRQGGDKKYVKEASQKDNISSVEDMTNIKTMAALV